MPRRVGPEEARDLLEKEGYVYVDVRSIPEFEAGHPSGAYSVPLMHMGPGGMTPNPDFLAVVQGAFGTDAKLVIGCKSGGRSLQAAAILERAGFTQVVDQRAGFDGTVNPQTGQAEPGWRPRGLPVSASADAARAGNGKRCALRARRRAPSGDRPQTSPTRPPPSGS
jgi:rhodanese-related sulfurtransferase